MKKYFGRKVMLTALLALLVAVLVPAAGAQDDGLTFGYIVKHLDNPWFIAETAGAQELADQLGVELLVQDVQFDSGLALSTLDTYISAGVDGLLVVVPEQQIGPAVMAAAAEAGIPLIAIDDEIQDAAGNPAPFAGIDAETIGRQVGTAAYQQYIERGWDTAENVGVINIEFAQLQVCVGRTDGSTAVWKELAPDFPESQMRVAPYDGTLNNAITTFSDFITANPDIERWVLYSCNDDGVMGAVRALEQAGVPAENIIGIGLGAHLACDEWAKPEPTGFSGAIFIDARTHGEFGVAALYNHVQYGVPLPGRTIATGEYVTPETKDIAGCE